MTDRELSKLVEDYRRQYSAARRKARRRRQQAASLAEAIELAAMSRDERGKCESHQCRVGFVALRRFAQALLAKRARIAACSTFDELHDLLWEARVPRVGVLAVYDVAERIGVYLRLEPETVYVHAGAREGARALGVKGVKGRASIDQFPAPLRRLGAAELENFLCICKRQLAGQDGPSSSCFGNGIRIPPATRRGPC